MAENREVEIKLALNAPLLGNDAKLLSNGQPTKEQFNRLVTELRSLLPLRSIRFSEAEVTAAFIEDTYYDDRSMTLLENDCSFRVRRTAEKNVLTLKVPISQLQAGLERSEINKSGFESSFELDEFVTNALSLEQLVDSDCLPGFLKATGALHAVVISENNRITLVGRSETAKFEFCVDCYWHIRVADGLRIGPYFELELEAADDAARESIRTLDEKITEVVSQSSRVSVARGSKYAQGTRRLFDKPIRN